MTRKDFINPYYTAGIRTVEMLKANFITTEQAEKWLKMIRGDREMCQLALIHIEETYNNYYKSDKNE